VFYFTMIDNYLWAENCLLAIGQVVQQHIYNAQWATTGDEMLTLNM